MTLTKMDEVITDLETYKERKLQNNDFAAPIPEVSRYKVENVGYNSDKEESFQGGEQIMDSKEYIDLKVNALEQNLNQKFEAQQNLFVEKINHLETKIDGQQNLILSKLDSLTASMNSQNELIKKDIEIISKAKVDDLERSLDKKSKEARNFAWVVMGVGVGAATLIVTTIIPLIQQFLSN